MMKDGSGGIEKTLNCSEKRLLTQVYLCTLPKTEHKLKCHNFITKFGSGEKYLIPFIIQFGTYKLSFYEYNTLRPDGIEAVTVIHRRLKKIFDFINLPLIERDIKTCISFFIDIFGIDEVCFSRYYDESAGRINIFLFLFDLHTKKTLFNEEEQKVIIHILDLIIGTEHKSMRRLIFENDGNRAHWRKVASKTSDCSKALCCLSGLMEPFIEYPEGMHSGVPYFFITAADAERINIHLNVNFTLNFYKIFFAFFGGTCRKTYSITTLKKEIVLVIDQRLSEKYNLEDLITSISRLTRKPNFELTIQREGTGEEYDQIIHDLCRRFHLTLEMKDAKMIFTRSRQNIVSYEAKEVLKQMGHMKIEALHREINYRSPGLVKSTEALKRYLRSSPQTFLREPGGIYTINNYS